MPRRKAVSKITQTKPNLLDPKLLIQVGMIGFAMVGFYFTTKSRLDTVEASMSEIQKSLTDSRIVTIELRVEEIVKDVTELKMELMSLEDWLDETLKH